MKKLLILLTLTLLACGREEEQKEEPKPVDNTTSVTITAPTLADGTRFEWQKGDIVAVCANSKGAQFYNLTATSAGHSVVFKGIIPKDLKTFKAFYPGGIAKESTSETNLSFPWADTQKETVSLPMIARSTSGDIRSGFTATALAGLVKFSLAGDDVTAVELTIPNTGDNYLGADLIICNTNTGNTSITSAKTVHYTLKMTPDATGGCFKSGTYSFSVLSKSSARSFTDYSLTYTKKDGSKVTRKFSDVLSITPGSVSSVPGTEKDVIHTSTKVSGKVTDSKTGTGIANVPVSDGVQIVKTASDGSYSFTSDLTVSQNVFVIMPAAYEFSRNEWNGWNNFQLLDSSKESQTADFKLTPRTDSGDSYRLLLLGDPQQMSSRPHSSASWTYVSSAINDYRSTVNVPLYEVSLGDMVTNEIEVAGKAEAYLGTQRTSGLTTFSTPGNHDHIQNATSYYASVSGFSKWFGPYNYAFNLGKQHLVFLDSCAWTEGADGEKYSSGFNNEAMNFLEKDLALVDKGTTVHIFTHCPVTKKHNAGWPSPLNGSRMLRAFAGRNVHMWYGHIHYNAFFAYTAEELSAHASGVKSLESHLVSRCGGNWGCSGEVCKDGTPRGFVELDLKGDEVRWQFHSIDRNYDSTMNFYKPGQFKGEGLDKVNDAVMYCNVYLWDNLWQTPEVWVDGKKTAAMTRVKHSSYSSYDPLYQHFHAIWTAEGKCQEFKDDPSASDNSHLFQYQPASGVNSVQIKVRDRWGETHTMDAKW